MTTELERIVSCLRDEFTLVNRGTGWFLAPKYMPYKKQPSELISDDIVNKLEADGVIEISVPYISAIATLRN